MVLRSYSNYLQVRAHEGLARRRAPHRRLRRGRPRSGSTSPRPSARCLARPGCSLVARCRWLLAGGGAARGQHLTGSSVQNSHGSAPPNLNCLEFAKKRNHPVRPTVGVAAAVGASKAHAHRDMARSRARLLASTSHTPLTLSCAASSPCASPCACASSSPSSLSSPG